MSMYEFMRENDIIGFSRSGHCIPVKKGTPVLHHYDNQVYSKTCVDYLEDIREDSTAVLRDEGEESLYRIEPLPIEHWVIYHRLARTMDPERLARGWNGCDEDADRCSECGGVDQCLHDIAEFIRRDLDGCRADL